MARAAPIRGFRALDTHHYARHMNRTHGLAASLALVALMAGCSPAPAPSGTPTATTPPTTTSTSTSTPRTPSTPGASPTPEPLTLPDCETLLPLATARGLFSVNTEFLGEIPVEDFAGRMPVPSLPTALASATPAVGCFWGVPQSDGLFQLVVGGITSAQRATLAGELSAAGYSTTAMGTVTAFELEGMNEVGSTGTTHLFTGEVWIVCDGTSLGLSGAVTASALDALRTANPTLGL
ncbi:hypothetical protein BH09ACT5_BH09ACT5_14480 [soil metagenome]